MRYPMDPVSTITCAHKSTKKKQKNETPTNMYPMLPKVPYQWRYTPLGYFYVHLPSMYEHVYLWFTTELVELGQDDECDEQSS